MIALINIDKKTFAATFDEIAAYIEKRGLFDEAENCPLPKQIMLRATQSGGRYRRYLFHQVDNDTIQLKSYPLIKKKAERKKIIVDGVDISAYTNSKKTIAKLKKNERILY